MIEHLLFLYDNNLDYVQRLVADLSDDKMAVQPAPKMNHAAWVIGHLAEASDLVISLLGGERLCPPEWAERLGMRSHPEPDRSLYPSKEELLAALERGHARVKELLSTIDPSRLDEPTPEPIRARYATKWPLVIHLLTGHEQMHLGQLSAWRRAQGYPSV